MYFIRKLIDFFFSGLATYRGIGEAEAGRRAESGLTIVPRYPPTVGLYPPVTRAEVFVAVALDGVSVGHLRQGRPLTIPDRMMVSGVLSFTSISGELLASVDFVRSDGGGARGRILRYFPELRDGRARRLEFVDYG